MPKMQFGKYAGLDISEVPDSYLEWMKRDADEKVLMCDTELRRRREKVDNSWMAKIVSAGYAQLISSTPNPAEQVTIGKARDALQRAIADAAKVAPP